MSVFIQYFFLSAPLFAIVLAGYLISLWPRWRRQWSEWATKFVFLVALPALLFHLMSKLSSLPPINAKLLIAFFGGCFAVFAVGRVIAVRYFKLDGVAQSVFAMGGIFSNNVLLGLPVAKMTLGPQALPSVALVVVFNAITLWTLVSVSIEWARHRSFTVSGLGKMAWGVVTSPLVASILLGTGFSLAKIQMPMFLDRLFDGMSLIAGPAALLVLGMGLAQYGFRSGWRISATISALKLLVQPLVVWMLAILLGLPLLETQAIVLLASMSVGTNVYLMSVQFSALQGPVASSLVLSTALAAFTTPLLLTLVAALR